MFTLDGASYSVERRDNQRSRVYAAERSIRYKGEKYKNLEDCQAAVDYMVENFFYGLAGRYGRRVGPVLVVEGRSRFPTSVGGAILVPPQSWNAWTLLHEMVHESLPEEVHHHWPFAAGLLDAVGWCFGDTGRRALLAGYEKNKVAWTCVGKQTMVRSGTATEDCHDGPTV